MKKSYFAYIRVSTVRQSERGSSLVEQRSAIEAYAARQDLSISHWFEETETAAKEGRHTFASMLQKLAAGEADGLIVHKIDRSARNLRDWANLGDLIDRGVDVRFVTDNFDLLSRGGRLSADIQAVVAADYIRNLRDEVKKGLYGRLKQGIYPWPAPVGYLNRGRAQTKAIDPILGPLVRQLFERYATNAASIDALRFEFAALGLCGKNGKPFAVNTLSEVPNNPFYMGVIRIKTNGETYSGIHEPLISKTLFDRVQTILRGKTVLKAKNHQFEFRQMIRCSACGRRTLTGERQKGRTYYRCHGRKCSGISWAGETIATRVDTMLTSIRLSEGDIGDVGDMIAEECRSKASASEDLKTSLRLRLQNIDDKLNRLTDLLVEDVVDKATFNARREKALIDRQGIAQKLSALDTAFPLEELFEKFERTNTELLRHELLRGDEKRNLLESVCSNFAADAQNLVFTLRNPFHELAKLANSWASGPYRDDVRTFQIFEILKRTAEGSV